MYQRPALTAARKLAIALSPLALFEYVTGFKADPWQVELMEGIAACANDRSIPDRNFHVNVHRQAGKSFATACAAAWVGAYSSMRGQPIVLVSVAQRQSEALLRKVKEFVRALPPSRDVRLAAENMTALELHNGTQILAMPSGADGNGDSLRGVSSVSLLVADEASRCPDALLLGACLPMLAASQGVLALLSTPAGRADWFGRLDLERPPGWVWLKAVAEDNPRFSKTMLEQMKKSLGIYRFRQEFSGSFSGSSDSFYSTEEVARALKPAATVPPIGGITRAA